MGYIKDIVIIKDEIITLDKQVRLRNGSIINRYSHLLAGASIGHNVMIGEHCYIASDVSIGHRCRIQNHNNLYDGLTLEDDVFIAPNVSISNHHDPSIRERGKFKADKVVIKKGAIIGIGSVIIAPRTIGEGAVVAGGAVVLRNLKKKERYYSLYKDKYESGLVQKKKDAK